MNPMVAGETICARGAFDDVEETGKAYFVVLRCLSRGVYLVAPLGFVDAYWGDHLSKTPQVKMKVLQTVSEKVPPEMELFRRWRVLSAPGTEPKKEEFRGLSKADTERALKIRRFLQDLMVSDLNQPQDRERSDPPLRKR